MERQNLTEPFDLHLQWFGDPPPDPAPGEPASGPDSQPAPEPKPLSAEGTWLSQASDKYKRDPKVLQDLLQGERACKSWSDVLGRMYAGEELAAQHQAKLSELQAQLEAATSAGKDGGQAPAPAPAEFKPEDYAKVAPGKLPGFMSEPAFEAYSKDLSAYLVNAAEEIRAAAAELKVSPAVAQRMVDLFAKRHVEAFRAAVEDEHQRREAGLKALKESWRGDFEKNSEIARRALASFGGPALATEISARGYGNDPAMLKIFHGIGLAIGEGQLVPGRPAPSPAGAPGASARERQQAASARRRYPNSPELTGGR